MREYEPVPPHHRENLGRADIKQQHQPFAPDSPVEGTGFAPSVPPRIDDAFKTALFAAAALPVPPERSARFERGWAVRIPFPPPASLISVVKCDLCGRNLAPLIL